MLGPGRGALTAAAPRQRPAAPWWPAVARGATPRPPAGAAPVPRAPPGPARARPGLLPPVWPWVLPGEPPGPARVPRRGGAGRRLAPEATGPARQAQGHATAGVQVQEIHNIRTRGHLRGSSGSWCRRIVGKQRGMRLLWNSCKCIWSCIRGGGGSCWCCCWGSRGGPTKAAEKCSSHLLLLRQSRGLRGLRSSSTCSGLRRTGGLTP